MTIKKAKQILDEKDYNWFLNWRGPKKMKYKACVVEDGGYLRRRSEVFSGDVTALVRKQVAKQHYKNSVLISISVTLFLNVVFLLVGTKMERETFEISLPILGVLLIFALRLMYISRIRYRSG